MTMNRKNWIQLGFWLLVTLVFLYERRYLIQKAGLGHFVECTVVRVGLIMALAYAHLRYFIPHFWDAGKYLLYGLLLLGSVFLYVTLQGAYDVYLYGFVIGIEESRNVWENLPYNVVTAAWYVGLMVALQRSVNWYEQVETLAKLRRENADLKDLLEIQAAQSEDMPSSIILKSGTQKVKIDLDAITHVQGLKDYSIIFTQDDKIIVRGNLKNVHRQFPSGTLVRAHKSYLVASEKIDAVAANEVVLGDITLPVGRRYKQDLEARWTHQVKNS